MRLVPKLLIVALALSLSITAVQWQDARAQPAPPLNFAILWHMHQPLYKNVATDEYLMPWVRDHGPNEYLDHPKLLAQYPNISLTFNLVPSLIFQMEDYAYNDSVDNHIKLARMDYATLDDVNRTLVAREFIRLAPWYYNSAANPYFDQYAIYPRLQVLVTKVGQDPLSLTDQELRDLTTIYFLRQISIPYVLGEYDVADTNDTIVQLMQQGSGFTLADTETVLSIQREIMKQVVPAYKAVQDSGQAEIVTTPYYHPISPLLMDDTIPSADGVHDVTKGTWENDTRFQYERAARFYEARFGIPPNGTWNSEGAISESIVPAMNDTGFRWSVSDEKVLNNSVLGGSKVGQSTSNKTKVYTVTVDGKSADFVFRDTEVSDRVSFRYGGMSTAEAVQDFMSLLQDRHDDLSDAERPRSVFVLAADGENWMFLAGYPNNGRDFLHAIYENMTQAQDDGWLNTVSLTDFIDGLSPSDKVALDSLHAGSWIDANFDTWSGEEDEQVGWARLAAARNAVVAYTLQTEGREFVDPSSSPEVKAAWEGILAAEGSDWFWWYGDDQDSGDDGNFDVLFKEHLRTAYDAIGVSPPRYVTARWGPSASADRIDTGILEPTLDGLASPGEWDNSSLYSKAVTGQELMLIEELYVGYDFTSLYAQVVLNGDPRDLIGTEGRELELYISKPVRFGFNNMQLNMNRYGVNFTTRNGDTLFEWPTYYRVRLVFSQAFSSGEVPAALWNGTEAPAENWWGDGPYKFKKRIEGAAWIGDVIEISLPLLEFEVGGGETLRLAAVTANETGDVDLLPSDPVEIKFPIPPTGPPLAVFEDPVGDDTGDGDYTYPLAQDFQCSDGQYCDVLFDMTHVAISETPVSVTFTFGFVDVGRNVWNGPNGFSFQIVNIYVDTDRIPGSGQVNLLEGPAARVNASFAWEVAVQAAGWSDSRTFVTYDSDVTQRLSSGLVVTRQEGTHNITIIVPKKLFPGGSPSDWGYVFVSGSQDGFGPGWWRDVIGIEGIWVGGGGAAHNRDPRIYDAITPEGVNQAAMLGGYTSTTFAELEGVTVPGGAPPEPPVAPNKAPTLSGMKVTPEEGDANTPFTFEVRYADHDGDDPSFVRIFLDNESREMSYVGGSNATGAVFRYTTALGAGDHSYRFAADDGQGEENSLVETATFTIAVRAPPFFSGATVAIIIGGVGAAVAVVLVLMYFMFWREKEA